MPLITAKRHKYSMVDIKTVISSKHRLRLIDSIKSIVITIKTTDLKRHRLYPTETHENRRQSTILPMKSFVWELGSLLSDKWRHVRGNNALCQPVLGSLLSNKWRHVRGNNALCQPVLGSLLSDK